MPPDDQPAKLDSPAKLKFARSQRFRLTARGAEAATFWKERLALSQGGGRTAFDSANNDWAKAFAVDPDDANYVAELSQDPMRVEDLLAALESTGVSRENVKTVLGRLHEKGLVEPVTSSL